MSIPPVTAFAVFVGLFSLRNVLEPFIKPGKGKGHPPRKRGTRSLALLTLPFLVSGAATALWLFRSVRVPGGWYLLGCLFLLTGFAGRILSLRTLAASYSLFIDPSEEGSLVTAGIYRLVRHPIYAFYCLEALGLLLARFNPVSLACLLVIAGTALFRAGVEDRVLRERFGQVAKDYQGKTRKFIPFLY